MADSNKPQKKGFSDIKEPAPKAKSSKPASDKSKTTPYTIGGLVVACWVALFVTGSVSTFTLLGMAVVTVAAGLVVYRHFQE